MSGGADTPNRATVIGTYTVLEKLGEGGMGSVYRAEDSRIGRIVAIKTIRMDRLAEANIRDRFVREARSIGALNHPNIATLYDVALDGDNPHIVMEYLPGGTLEALIRRGNLTLNEILSVAVGVASGLAHAHAHGLVHRDLKPANILFSADGVPKIIDFGLARAHDSTGITQSGVVSGTVDYMSPEQACGKPPDQRSDLFSFGVILYKMASGHNPFHADSVPAILHAIVYSAAPPLATVRPELPQSFSETVDRLLDKDPGRRPDIASILSTLHATETSSRGDTRTMVVPGLRAGWSSRRWLVTGVLLLLLVLGALAGWMRWRRRGPVVRESRQLVILPFDNLSHDPVDQAFCDGLVELLTSSLTQMERFHSSLWVIPSADVRRLQLHSVGDARKAFPINLAVTGSLQSDGDRILVVMNLSDAATLRQIGSRIIPVSRADRSQLMTQLMSALLELLDLSGQSPPGVQPKTAPAYNAYLEGKGFLLHSEVPANLDRAVERLEQSVNQEPDFAAAQSSLADAYLRRFQVNKDKIWLARADQAAQRALAIDPHQPQVHSVLGKLFRATGETARAVAEFQRAIALDPMDVAAYTQLASAYRDARRPQEAERTFQEAIRIRPSYWPAYTNLGIFYMNRGEYQKAEEPLSFVVKLAPESVDGHTNLGTLFYFMNRFDDALAEFSKSIALRPTTTAYSNRGAIYHFKGEYARAREDYHRAIALDGNNPLFWGNLADADSQIAGAEAEAKDSYLHAIHLSRGELEVNPNDPNLLGRMAFYLARTSSCSEARSRMKEALRLAPDRVPLIFKAAKVAEACQDRPAALVYLRTAIEKGYPQAEVESDPDLRALRQTPEYATIRPSAVNEKR